MQSAFVLSHSDSILPHCSALPSPTWPHLADGIQPKNAALVKQKPSAAAAAPPISNPNAYTFSFHVPHPPCPQPCVLMQCLPNSDAPAGVAMS